MGSTADNQLLLGLLALQNGFITRDQLVAAFSAWVVDKSRPLDTILLEQKVLTPALRELLAALAVQHLAKNGDDPAKSLAALSSVASARMDLNRLQDGDLCQSLDHINASAFAPDPYATRAGVSQIPGQRFQILRPHAAGGLGTVSIAYDSEVAREVALKEIRPESSDNMEARSRFLREAEITGGLEHPGIVPVYGLGTYADGRPYYAMKFIKGDSLQTAAARFHQSRQAGKAGFHGVEFRELLQRFIDVCQAIQYAHDRGVLHRDLKPGNIMLGQYGETLVVDWGLAKAMGESAATDTERESRLVPRTALSGTDASGTQAGSAIGTPQYMSPEQAEGRLDELGPTTDVYALGATLYYLLTGKPPAAGSHIAEVLENVRRGNLVPPREHVPDVPKPLEAICRKSMSLQLTNRYPDARQLATEIRRWLADEPVMAYRENWIAQASRWFRRHRAVAVSISVVAPVIIASIGIASYLIGAAEQSAAQSQYRETQALALSTQVTAFESALDRPNWDPEHLGRLDDMVANLQKLSPEQATQANTRLTARYAKLIEQKLQRPRLSDADIQELEQDLAQLDARDTAAAKQIQQALAVRLRSWEVVAELPPDFDDWNQLLDRKMVALENGNLIRQTPTGDSPSVEPPASERVMTTLSATNDIQCEVSFDVSVPPESPVGVEFLTSDKSGYSFLVVPTAKPKPTNSQELEGEAEDPLQNVSLSIVIQRDGLSLRETPPFKHLLADGKLTIHAIRQGERLQIQVNNKPPIEMLDPFPLSTATPGVVAVRWPHEFGSLTRFVGSQMRQPTAPSPLEAADQLYAAQQYQDALRKYAEQERQAPNSGYGDEARYKQALCLQALERWTEARPLYEQLSNSGNPRWGTLADFQLWAYFLETQEDDLAEAILDRLSQKYSFDDLGRIAPQETRQRIYQASAVAKIGSRNFLIFDPQRLAKAERGYRLHSLLDPGSLEYHETAYNLILTAAFLQQYDQCLQVLHDKLPHPSDWFDVTHFRILREMGRPQMALEEVEKMAASDKLQGLNRDDALSMQATLTWERILCLHALGQADEAKALIDEILPTVQHLKEASGETSMRVVPLLRAHAILEAEAGNQDVALQTWRLLAGPNERVLLSQGAYHRGLLIAQAMSGQLEAADVDQLLQYGAVADTTGMGKVILSYSGRDTIANVIKSMWVSPRGKKVTRRIAFEEANYQEEYLSLPTLAAYQFLATSLANEPPDPEQDEAFWSFAEMTVQRMALDGRLQQAHLVPLAVTWKGNTGFLGWSTVQSTLDAEYRGHIAYIFGLRYRKLNQPDQARMFFETAIKDSASDSLVAKLASRELSAP
ncbi:protein kinase [bacterium]|nr:protein kinase [bacterium]